MKLSADKAGTVLILAGLIFSLFHLQTRLKTENDNRRVEILISPEEGHLSESAVIQEYSFKELNFMAIATRWSPGLSHPFKKINSGSTVLIFQDRDFYKEAFATAKIKFNDKVEKKEKKGLYYIYFKDLSWDKVAPVGAGIVYPKKNFKRLYIRPLNDRKVNRESIDRIFDRSTASGMIFKGEEVLGFPDKLDYVNKRIKKKNMLILNIEFFPQRGMKKLSSGLRASLLHSLPDFLEPDQSLLRAKRAMRERSARVFYFKEKGAALKFKKLLQKYILVLGEPGGIIIGSDFSFMPIFSAFFIITGLMLLAGVSSRALLYLFIIFSTFLAAGEGGRHFLIPVTAAIIPPLSIKTAQRRYTTFIRALVFILCFSLLGGLLIASLGWSGANYTKISTVRGIKFSYLIPLFLGAWLFLKNEILNSLSRPVKWVHILAGAAFLALMALLMLRSSNVGGGFVLNAELNIREAMEKFFVWRPRFKEFLFGHPLLMGGLYLYFKGGKGSVLSKIMIIGGITGISSVLNSFMHIHTPLAGSIIRSFFGWVMAVIPAAVIIFFTEKWLIREK